MARILKAPVHTNGEHYAAGATVGDGPGQIPEHVADRITNPKAWEDDGEDVSDEELMAAAGSRSAPDQAVQVEKVGGDDDKGSGAAAGAEMARRAARGNRP